MNAKRIYQNHFQGATAEASLDPFGSCGCRALAKRTLLAPVEFGPIETLNAR
jgi:hypothetical protein